MFKSSLYDETTFYPKFVQDLLHASREVVIESPYITAERMRGLFPVFERLIERGVKVYVLTRDPREHSESLEYQSEAEIQRFEELVSKYFFAQAIIIGKWRYLTGKYCGKAV